MILECFFFFLICISLSPFKVRQYSHLTGEGMATGGGGHEGGATFIQVMRISSTKVEVRQSSGVNMSSLKSGGR